MREIFYKKKAVGFWLLCLILLLCGAGLLYAKPVRMIVAELSGTAKAGVHHKMHPLHRGHLVKQGETLQTDANSSLELKTRHLNFKVGANSKVRVDALLNGGQNQMHVQKGQAWFHLQKNSNSKLKVTTPTAVASVRGTKFAVVSSEAGTLTCVCKGSIATNPARKNSTEILKAGDSLSVAADGSIKKKDFRKYFKGANSDHSFKKEIKRDARLAYCLSCHPGADLDTDRESESNDDYEG